MNTSEANRNVAFIAAQTGLSQARVLQIAKQRGKQKQGNRYLWTEKEANEFIYWLRMSTRPRPKKATVTLLGT